MQNEKRLHNISDNESSDSDVLAPIKKRLIISENNEEETKTPESGVSWIWEKVKINPIIWKFSESPGIKSTVLRNLNKDPELSELFYIMFDDKFWELIVSGTNAFANHAIRDEDTKRKVFNTWFPVNVDEIKAYYALCILMAQVKKPNIQMYWSKRAVVETPIFGKVMPFKRFRQISRFLYFVNNETVDNNDRFQKIRPIIAFWNKKFEEIYTPSEDVSIFKSLMKYKSRLANKNFKKPTLAVKFYKLCESSTGYCHGFRIYTSQEKNDQNDVSENVVMDLSKSVLKKGYTMFLDNSSSSPNLFLRLHQEKTNIIGIARSNCKNMPKDIQKNILNKGECLWRTFNNLLVLRWKGKRDVYMLSTKHGSVETVSSDVHVKKMLKPKCVIEYNKGMCAVDHQNQMLACFPIMRKIIKGYRKLIFYMTDMALFNTYIMHKSIHSKSQETYADYRINIAEVILKNVQLPDYSKGEKRSPGDTPFRLQAQRWAHFPKNIDPTPRKKHPTKMCKVCYKHKTRRETTWECTECKVALHLPECFRKYHTLQDY